MNPVNSGGGQGGGYQQQGQGEMVYHPDPGWNQYIKSAYPVPGPYGPFPLISLPGPPVQYQPWSVPPPPIVPPPPSRGGPSSMGYNLQVPPPPPPVYSTDHNVRPPLPPTPLLLASVPLPPSPPPPPPANKKKSTGSKQGSRWDVGPAPAPPLKVPQVMAEVLSNTSKDSDSTSKPAPPVAKILIGKRRGGGKALPTGVIKRPTPYTPSSKKPGAAASNDKTDNASKDPPLSRYLAEVERYKGRMCTDENYACKLVK